MNTIGRSKQAKAQRITVDGELAEAYELDETGRWVTCRFVGCGKFFIEHPENIIGLDLNVLPQVH